MESTRQNNNINAINNARMLLNELRSNLSREETKRNRDINSIKRKLSIIF